ncbi:DNA (cytosine-5-)-methyltransferase [bacterium]|nr:DNA (cytosine-5-)-methyltransferase [bacterium]
MRTFEIFSGAGGLAKGLELAGFVHSKFVEMNKDACSSLAKNFDQSIIFCGDIRSFELKSLGKIDVVAGGPPCQPFSLGGKHLADLDSRDMFPHAIKAIEYLQPKAFVFENVKGLLRPNFKEYFEYIILRLTYPFVENCSTSWQEHFTQLKKINKRTYDKCKYNVQFKLVNAANFGVPQTRERVIIVGIRSDLGLQWEYPEETHSEDSLLWDMYVSGHYWERHKIKCPCYSTGKFSKNESDKIRNRLGLFKPEKRPWITIRDAIGNVPDPKKDNSIQDHIFRDGAKSYPGHTGSDYDWPAKTIKAGGHGVPGGENMIRYPDNSLRYFTVFEAKKIQTFPDDFIIMGSWGEALRQIGNAVPVKLAEVIGTKLFKTLNTNKTIEIASVAKKLKTKQQEEFLVANL